MNLNHIESFVSVADEGSFSKAANALFLKQPTVSAHISALEKELGVKLFERNTKEVSLTVEGYVLYSYAREMVNLENKIKNVFKCTRNEDDGCLYIAASSVPAKYILPHILESYMEEYPDAVFKVMEADSSTVIETVLRGNAHIGFTGARFKKNHCTYIPFYDDEMVVITPNNLKFRKLKELHFGKKFSELKTTDIPCAETYWIEKEHIILRENGSGTRKETEKLLVKMGLNVKRLNIASEINDPETIKRYVRKGMGISIISKLEAEEEIEDGKLLCFSLKDDIGKRKINMVCSEEHSGSEKNKFIEIVGKMFGGM